MEKNETILFEEIEYHYNRKPEKWEVVFSLSDIDVSSKEELALVELDHTFLLPCTTKWEEDQVVLELSVENKQTFTEIQKLPRLSKLRAALNVADLRFLLDYPLTFFISPENIVFDRNVLPKLAYRGWKGKMGPKNFDEMHLFRQYKAFLLTLFDENHSFHGLYNGEIELKATNEFSETVKQSEDFEKLVSYVESLYQAELKNQNERMRVVPKRQFTLFKYGSIWVSVLSAVLLISVGYLLLFRLPFQQQLLEADRAFFQRDYAEVLDQLSDINTENLPRSQKYISAYSVVQGASLNDDQRQVIFNTLSLNADERYLDYWVEIGRGEFTEALDAARSLEDADLILYGLAMRIEQVRSDNSLSGQEQEDLLNQLQEEYQRYEDGRQELLQEPEENEADDIEEETMDEEPDAENETNDDEEAGSDDD